MNNIIKTIFLGLFVCATSHETSYAQNNEFSFSEGIIVRVNSDIISTYDLKQRIQLIYATSDIQDSEETRTVIQNQSLRNLIDEKLKLQELAKWKVKVEDSEIDEEIERMASQANIKGDAFLKELSNLNISPETLKQQIRAEIGWNMLVGGRFRSAAKVGKDQVDTAYYKVIENSQKVQYRVAEIFLDFDAVEKKEDAINGAKQIHAQLLRGVAPFTSIARRFSNAPSAANGGVAEPWVSGDIDEKLESVLVNMQPDSMSPPIETDKGIYIIYLIKKNDGKADLNARLLHFSTGLKSNFDKQSKELSDFARNTDCSTKDFNKADVSVRDLGSTKLSDLKPYLNEKLINIKARENTEPFIEGETVSIFKVCDWSIADEQSPTKEKVERSMVSERIQMLGKRYLRDLRNSATIENKFD